jgi:hypothetical protein
MAGQHIHPAFQFQIGKRRLERGGGEVTAPEQIVNRYRCHSN